MNRREFLGGLSAFAALSGCKSAGELFALNPARLKFGVLSDVHCQYRAFTDTLERAFAWFRDHGVDAVVIAGDIADMGMYEELRFVADCWNRVFPNGLAPDGRKVEHLFVTGNHDVAGRVPTWTNNATWQSYYCGDIEEMKRHNLCTRRGGIAAAWEECFGEKYEKISRRTVKGYDFILSHWDTWSGVDGLEDYFRKVGPTLDASKPFFYVQHPHPKSTVYGEWAWGADDGRSTRALSAFPNAVAFSGHSHFSLTCEKSIWQGAFTSIGTATLAAAEDDYGGREESGAFPGEQVHVPVIGGRANGKQGLLVTVCDDFVTVERHDFVYGKSLGEPWVFTAPVDPSAPKYAFAAHAAAEGAPQFAADAKVTVAEGGACDRCRGKSAAHVTVRFPVPRPAGGVRAYDFEVALEARVNNVVKPFRVKRTMCRTSYLGAEMEAAEAECLFAAAELPPVKCGKWQQRGYRFRVTPYSSLGAAGNPIYSDWQGVKA